MVNKKPVLESKSKSLGISYVYVPYNKSRAYVTEDGILLLAEEVKGKTGEEVCALYASKKKSNVLFDYEYAKTTSFVRKRKEIPAQQEGKYTEPVVRQKEKFEFDPIMIVLAGIVLVAAGAAFMSINYTAEYLLRTVGPFRAYAQSTAMVIFASLAFDVAIILYGQKEKSMKAAAVLLILSWVICASYSMFTTMYISYETLAVQDTGQASSSARNTLLLDSLNRAVEDADKNLTSARDALDKYKERENAGAWYITSEYMPAVERASEEKRNAEEALKVYLLSTDISVEEAKEVPKDFFALTQSVIGVPVTLQQFIVNTLPAVFLDIITPFGIAIVMLLWKIHTRKKKGEN